MIISLSTSWTADTLSDPRQVLDMLAETGVPAVELDYRLRADMFHRLTALLKENGYRISSLHNYCPFPEVLPNRWPSGDYFSLSSLDVEERKLAVNFTTRTIEHAHDLEAGAVVLHCGAVGMPVDMDRITKLQAAGPERADELQSLIADDLQKRRSLVRPYLDALLFSLDELLPRSEKYQVVLGLENRFHYHELPSKEEFEQIFTEFAGGPVGYWHDCGHAHALEVLGLLKQKELFESFSSRLAGVHLHDSVGLSDHLPPGSGEIDYGFLKPQLKSPVPLVIELQGETSAEQVRSGADFVHQRIIF